MPNYLNQIESDLYKLNSITDGSGEVVEMVAELKEKYLKAEAFDAICKAHVPLEKRMSPVTVDEGLDFAVETEGVILKFYESGERNEYQ